VGVSVSMYFAFLIILAYFTPFLLLFCPAFFFCTGFSSAEFELFSLRTFPDLDFPIRLDLGWVEILLLLLL
jgi:hypothetical protein